MSQLARLRGKKTVQCTHFALPDVIYIASCCASISNSFTEHEFFTHYAREVHSGRISISGLNLGAVHILRQPKWGVRSPPPPRQRWSAFG